MKNKTDGPGEAHSAGWCHVFYADWPLMLTTGMDPEDLPPRPREDETMVEGFTFIFKDWVRVDERSESDLSKTWTMWIPREKVRSINECADQNPLLDTKWNICNVKTDTYQCTSDVVPGFDRCALHLRIGVP
jgi:hypothetical protein